MKLTVFGVGWAERWGWEEGDGGIVESFLGFWLLQ